VRAHGRGCGTPRAGGRTGHPPRGSPVTRPARHTAAAPTAARFRPRLPAARAPACGIATAAGVRPGPAYCTAMRVWAAVRVVETGHAAATVQAAAAAPDAGAPSARKASAPSAPLACYHLGYTFPIRSWDGKTPSGRSIVQ